MMPGDVPCNAECRNTLCGYCVFGVCVDNAPCENRIRMAEDNEDNLDEGEGE